MWIRRRSELALFVVAALAARAHPAWAAPPVPGGSAGDAPDESLAGFREQFKLGMDRYRAGAIAEAIGYWEPIYRELGDDRGYRLAYDLGVAYLELGDATPAAERLQTFLAGVQQRRARNEDLAPLVLREERDARARLDHLVATRGRIHVQAGAPPQAARVDAGEPRLAGFVAWVSPGEHRVTFGTGTPDPETVVVRVEAGDLVEIAPTPPPLPLPPATPAPAVATVLFAPPPPPLPTRSEARHPFPWPLLAVSGGAALAAGIAAVPLYGDASSLYDRLHSQSVISSQDREQFGHMRTLAYAVGAGAIGLTAITAGLATWYFLGTSEREVVLVPTIALNAQGAGLAVDGRF